MTDTFAASPEPTPAHPDRRWSYLGIATIASWIAVLGAWFFENYLWGVVWILADNRAIERGL